jgi:hypothetical protein
MPNELTIEAAGLAVGPALKRYRVKKHFDVQITDTSFTYKRKAEQIQAEAALDGGPRGRANAGHDALRHACRIYTNAARYRIRKPSSRIERHQHQSAGGDAD